MIAALFAMLLVTWFLSPPASATSVYDDDYQTTDRLIVHNPNSSANCALRDITYDYYDVFFNQPTWNTPSQQASWETSFQNALDNGSWSVTAWHQVSNGYASDYVDLSWIEDARGVVTFDNSPFVVFSAPSGHEVHSVTLMQDGTSCELFVSGAGILSLVPISVQYPGLYDVRNLLAANADVVYPTGYEGKPIRSELPPVSYVAMGDSFSSGEGNPPFEYGTDTGGTNENRCHRSPQAYPRLLQSDSSLELGPTAFVACSGATTADVLYGGSGEGNWSEGPQVDALSEDTEIVTITIGGNDVGFVWFAADCFIADCSVGSSNYNYTADKIEDPDFQEALESTYLEILGEAQNAQVYVLNYPYIIKGTEDCDAFPSLYSSANDEGAEAMTTLLNSTIWSAYNAIKTDIEWSSYASRLHFIDVTTYFDGMDLCSSEEDWGFYPYNLSNLSESLHPNTKGQEAYHDAIYDELS